MKHATPVRSLSQGVLFALVPFLTLAVLAVGVFGLTAWLDGGVAGWWLKVSRFFAGDGNVVDAEVLSETAEVVAAVLAIAITVVAIVVELAANRYTHRPDSTNPVCKYPEVAHLHIH